MNLFDCMTPVDTRSAVKYADDKKQRYSKQGRNSRLVVRLMGCVLSHEALTRSLGQSAMRPFNSSSTFMAVDYERRLYCGVEYGPRGVNFSLVVAKMKTNQHIGIAYYGEGLEQPVVVARRTYEVRLSLVVESPWVKTLGELGSGELIAGGLAGGAAADGWPASS